MSDLISDPTTGPLTGLGFLIPAAFWAIRYFLRPRPVLAEPRFEALADDPELGEISYAACHRRLRVRPFFQGRRISLTLLDAEPPPLGLEPMWSICPGLDRIACCGREVAARDLLDVANRDWRRNGDAERDAAAFAVLALDEVVVARDGSFRMRFDDGGLFWGHLVEVQGRWDDGTVSASIVG